MADTKVEQQNVTIGFKSHDYIPAKYVFEMDDRPDEDQTLYGAVRIRKYPAFTPGTWSPVGTPMHFDQTIKTLVTEGELVSTREVREKEVSGSWVVNGDAECTLSYPVVRGLSYYVDGQAYDIRGNEINVHVGFDSTKNALVLSRPCYVVVKFFYITQYQIFRYYPNIYNDFEMYYMPDPDDYGQLLGFIRTPPIIDPIAPIVFAISPPEGISAEFELYRVESSGLARESGMWEKPMGWPTNGTYPNSAESIDPNASNIEIARTHEVGYFSLLNNPSRMSTYQSSATEALPLDYTKELRNSSYAGRTVMLGTATESTFADGSKVEKSLRQSKKVQDKEHFDKYRRLLNRAPKMRTVHYDVPVGEPYKSNSDINARREVVRTAPYQKVTDPDGNSTTRKVILETLVSFRIKLVVKAPTRPVVSTAVIRNQSNANNVDFNTQAQRINTMLSLIWEGIDWKHLKKRIIASYDPDIYQVTFDSSFPSTN